MIEWLADTLLNLCLGCREAAVVLISCVPLAELKGAIPIGTEHLGLSLGASFGLAFLGSSLMCIPLLLILKPMHRWAKHQPDSIIARGENIFKQKAKGLSEKNSVFYKMLSVFCFTAVPLPLTGVCSAAVISVLIGLPFLPSVAAIISGNLVAGGLILLLTALLGHCVDLFIYILFVFALVLFAAFVYKLIRNTNTKEITNGKTEERGKRQ